MREFSAHPHSQGNSPMTATIHESPVQVKQAPAAIAVSGLVDLADSHAFVRTSGYRRGPEDIYVSAAQIRQYGLRKGDLIEGTARPQANTTARGKFRPLLAVDTVNSRPPGLPRPRKRRPSPGPSPVISPTGNVLEPASSFPEGTAILVKLRSSSRPSPCR